MILRMSRPAGHYHHGDLAAALELAAIELLSEKGAANLSLREVARRAGVSHSAPYHHYADRQELLKAVAARSLHDLLDAMTAARDRAGSPKEQLVAVGIAYVDFAIEHVGQFGTMYDPQIWDPREHDPVTGPRFEASYELLANAVRAAVPNQDEETLPLITAGLWSLVHGLANLIAAGHLPREIVPATLNALIEMRLD